MPGRSGGPVTHSQCLYVALDKWHKEGGYLVLGKSTHWLLPHVLHMSNDKVLTHFVPPKSLKAPWYALFGFDGSVVVDDPVPRAPMSKLGMLVGSIALLTLGCVWAVRRTLKPADA